MRRGTRITACAFGVIVLFLLELGCSDGPNTPEIAYSLPPTWQPTGRVRYWIDGGGNIEFTIENTADTLVVEGGIAPGVVRELEALGHTIRTGTGLGNAHGLTIHYDADGRPLRFEGGADPRGRGLAGGY